MKKPNASAIQKSEPLTPIEFHGDPTRCNVCGAPSPELGIWRAHDERDQPIRSTGALIFLGNDHAACKKRLDDHPRLYAEEMGLPGHFPRLCGGCSFRAGLGCTHPKLKKNGGPGLNVQLSGMFGNVIICRRGHGCERPLKTALSCEGQTLPGETP